MAHAGSQVLVQPQFFQEPFQVADIGVKGTADEEVDFLQRRVPLVTA